MKRPVGWAFLPVNPAPGKTIPMNLDSWLQHLITAIRTPTNSRTARRRGHPWPKGANRVQLLESRIVLTAPDVDLSMLLPANGGDGSVGFTLLGIDQGDRSGQSVSVAGDVNGDGFDDLLIGAFLADAAGNAKNRAGESYVVFGNADWSASPTLDLATLNGTNGFTLFGADADDWSGLAVSGAGDVNRDGFDDLVISAIFGDGPLNANGGVGESYVVFGKADWSTTATLDLSTI